MNVRASALISPTFRPARRSPLSIAKLGMAGLTCALLATSLGGCPDPTAGVGDLGAAAAAAGTGQNNGGSASSNSSGSSGANGGSASSGSGGVVFNPQPAPPTVPNNQPAPTLPAGALSIVTLGDSLTEGAGDESAEGGGYPFRLLNAVLARRADSQVLNVGHSGWTSSDLINGQGGAPSELEEALAAKPDIACVWIGSNDLWQLYNSGPEEGTTPEAEAANLAVFAANIDTILSRLRASGAAVYLGLSDDQSKRPTAGTALCCITPTELAQMSAQVNRYNDVMIAAAKKHGATVVDFFNTTFFTQDALLDPDGIHPNAAGYDQVAAIWLAAISPAIN